MDDNNPEQQFSDAYDLNSPATSTRLVSISAVLLLAICFIIICFHSYGRWLLHRRSRSLHRRPHPPVEEGIIIIDPSLLKSLPTFRCSPSDPAASLECAVCLSEFEDGESGRTLPKCGHSFHMECIDMWLYSHSSCPLCRSPVFPAEGPCRSVAVPVSAGSEAQPTGGSQVDHDNQMGGSSSSSSLTASESGGRRKPDELVAITVQA